MYNYNRGNMVDEGRLLVSALGKAGVTRDDVFITNVVDWHPTNNHRITRQDIESGKPRLKRELEGVSPKLVICLGKVGFRHPPDVGERVGQSILPGGDPCCRARQPRWVVAHEFLTQSEVRFRMVDETDQRL